MAHRKMLVDAFAAAAADAAWAQLACKALLKDSLRALESDLHADLQHFEKVRRQL